MSKPGAILQIPREVRIQSGRVRLEGELLIPARAAGIVLFAHGSGSSRHSPRNKYVAWKMEEGGVATLLFDLLTLQEEEEDRYTGHFRFDIPLLARRLVDATNWTRSQPETENLRIGYFGSSTGAAAALIAASEMKDTISAIVSRGGRVDMARSALARVKAPTLLIVGGFDETIISLNWDAYSQLRCEKELKIVEEATHLFEEPGALEQVAELATDWFQRHFKPVGTL
ncbi:MAG: dienelactone hydrolase family protein [Acidobacteriota bacterium]